jgi:hypothetical protein
MISLSRTGQIRPTMTTEEEREELARQSKAINAAKAATRLKRAEESRDMAKTVLLAASRAHVATPGPQSVESLVEAAKAMILAEQQLRRVAKTVNGGSRDED